MGTTAEKGARVLQSIAEVQEGINNLGGNLTDQTPFKDFKAQLDEIYNNLPKTEYGEGTSVTLENCLKGKLDYDNGVVGIGQTEQDSTQGYNLLDVANASVDYEKISTHSTTQTGYEFTTTNTASSTAYGRILITTSFIDSSKTYGISFDVTSNVTGNFMCGWLGASKSNQSQITANTKTHMFFSWSGITTTTFTLGIYSGNTKVVIENLQIYEGSTDKTYEPYTGGQASPSPNWEQQVKCVAGINILDDSKLTLFANNRYISTIDYLTKGQIPVNSKKTYSLVYLNNTLGDIGLFEYDSSNTKTTINATTLTNGTHRVKVFNLLSTTKTFGFYAGGDNSVDTISQFLSSKEIMLLEGDYSTKTIPSYLPYNTIEEVVRGINIYSGNVELGAINGANGQNESNSSVIRSTTYANVEKIRKIAIVGSDNASRVKVLATYDKDYHYLGNSTIPNNNVFDIDTITISNQTSYYTSNSDIYYVRFVVTGTTDTTINYGIIDNSTTYEPYKTPKTYQFSLGDHKFYGIGTYRDYILRTTGKNLCNGVNQDYWINSAGTQAGKTTGNSGLAIPIKTNTTYTISTIATQERYRAGFVSSLPVDNAGVTIYSGQNKDNTNNSITITNTNYQYLIVNATDLTKVQIEESASATGFQPYGVGNFYKFEKIGFYRITGQERIDYDDYFDRFALNNLVDCLHLQARSQIYCNRYPFLASGNADYGMFTYWNGAITQVFVYDKDQQYPSNLQNYFANNETYLCYIRNTPVLTPITGTLAEQLEEWWNGQSLDGTTIIEGDGDLPMIINVRALEGES